ncbi:MAG: hypothetical protein ISP24_01300 [Rickettsiales bacterium]|nr:hypothetical protein [Rickettsiales bacterium]
MMKKTLFFSTILAASAAYSVSANATTAIDSLFFKPSHNEIYSDTRIGNYDKNNYTVDGLQNYRQDLSLNFVEHTIGYGVTDRLTVKTEILYGEAKIESASSFLEADGFQNPKFSLLYRAADQKDQGFYTDLKLSYAPDLFDSEDADTNKKGNLADGNDEFAFGFSFGKDIDRFTYKLDLDTIFKGNNETKDLSDDSIKTADSTTDYKFGIETQYRIFDNTSINLGANKLVKGTTASRKGGNELTLSAGINYVLNSSLLLNFAYEMQEIDDKLKTPENTRSSYDSESKAYGLKVRYIF